MHSPLAVAVPSEYAAFLPQDMLRILRRCSEVLRDAAGYDASHANSLAHSRASRRCDRGSVNYRDPALIRHSRSPVTPTSQTEREIRRSRSRDRSRRSLATATSEKFEIYNNLMTKKFIGQPSATRGWYSSRRRHAPQSANPRQVIAASGVTRSKLALS